MKTFIKITVVLFICYAFQSCSKEDDTPPPMQNRVPVINDQSFTAAENIADTISIGTIEATDPDGDVLSFSITTNDGNLFEISETGELSLAEGRSLDFETSQNHTIGVQVSDGNASTAAVIGIQVTDINENQPPVISGQSFTVLENIADNMPIGTVEASDPEGDTLTFGISTNDNSLFEISNAGVLSLDDLQELDFNTAQSHTITVTVTDGTSTQEAEITISVIELKLNAFITTWETTNANEVVTIPTRATELNYDYTIDWGDGTTQRIFNQDGSHRYTQPGTYIVIITGQFPAIVLDVNEISQEQIRSVEQWGSIQWQTMANAFKDASNLMINANDTPDLSLATTMNNMFDGTNNLTGNLNNWDVSNIVNMYRTFHISGFNQDISGWDVSNVTTMRGMFGSSRFNQDISTWDVSNVQDMDRMFRNAQFNQNISAWDLRSVIFLGGMFQGARFNQNISTWDVSNASDMSFMFNRSSFNQDISAWNVSNVTNMRAMFDDSRFNQDISAWNTSNVTNMESMFEDAPFNQDISNWNVSNVTNCSNFSLNAPLTAANRPNFINCTP